MGTIVLEHVKAGELPAEWLKLINAKPDEIVRVTIAKEAPATAHSKDGKPNSSFGMWADREDIGEASEYVARIRQPRHTRR